MNNKLDYRQSKEKAHDVHSWEHVNHGSLLMRPIPLFSDPGLVEALASDPQAPPEYQHYQYLADRLSGRVLIVAQPDFDAESLSKCVSALPDVAGVEVCINGASTRDDVATLNLDPDASEFEAIVYLKSTTQWVARMPDFQALTDYLTKGGLLLSRTKWVPDSKVVSLENIIVDRTSAFTSPIAYLEYRQSNSTLANFEANETTTDPEEPTPPTEFGSIATGAELLDRIPSPLIANEEKTEYSPGWSWHSQLIAHVKSRLDKIRASTAGDARIANLCCGTNPLGDIRVDLHKQYTNREGETKPTAVTHQADARDLPFHSNSLDAVLSDPPWKIPPKRRIEFFSEAVRVTKPGGTVLYNSPWLPFHPYTELVDLRATTANVTDSSVHGPGGLSFLTQYEVHPTSEITPEYTLAEHADMAGLEAVGTKMVSRWPRRCPSPIQVPAADPRILDPKTDVHCDNCGSSRLSISNIDTQLAQTAYPCLDCQFPNGVRSLLTKQPDGRSPQRGDMANQPSPERHSEKTNLFAGD